LRRDPVSNGVVIKMIEMCKKCGETLSHLEGEGRVPEFIKIRDVKESIVAKD